MPAQVTEKKKRKRIIKRYVLAHDPRVERHVPADAKASMDKLVSDGILVLEYERGDTDDPERKFQGTFEIYRDVVRAVGSIELE